MINLPRLTPLPKPRPPSCGLRCLTTALLRFERSQHIPSAGPRAHPLGIIAELILHDAIEQLHLLANRRSDGFEIGARACMLAPARPRRLQRPLELAQGS